MKNNTFQLPAELSSDNLQASLTPALDKFAQMRLEYDFAKIMKEQPAGVSVSVRTNDVTTWDAEICGAATDISFKVDLKFLN